MQNQTICDTITFTGMPTIFPKSSESSVVSTSASQKRKKTDSKANFKPHNVSSINMDYNKSNKDVGTFKYVKIRQCPLLTSCIRKPYLVCSENS